MVVTLFRVMRLKNGKDYHQANMALYSIGGFVERYPSVLSSIDGRLVGRYDLLSLVQEPRPDH